MHALSTLSSTTRVTNKSKSMAPISQCFQILLMLFSFLSFLNANSQNDQASIQIVYMARSKESTASHVSTLATVLGSEVAAKKAIIYEYTRTMNSFAAKLTTDQISALLKQPAVLKILPDDIRTGDVSTSTTP